MLKLPKMGLSILPPTPDLPSQNPRSHINSSSPMLTSSDSEPDSDDDNTRPRKRARHNNSAITIPGEIITSETQWMRGHGTFIPGSDESNAIHASLAGPVEKTNRLLTVVPMRAREYLTINPTLSLSVIDFQSSFPDVPTPRPPTNPSPPRLHTLHRRPPHRPHPLSLRLLLLARRHRCALTRPSPSLLYQSPRRHSAPTHHSRRTADAQLLPGRGFTGC